MSKNTPEKHSKKGKKEKFLKLSVKFMRLSIIPSVFLMFIFVVVSFYAAGNVSLKNLRGSLEGQSVAKNKAGLSVIGSSFQGSNINIASDEICRYVSNNNLEARCNFIKNKVNDMNSKSIYFKDVGVALFDDDIIIKSSGNFDISKNKMWYEEEKIKSGMPYYHLEDITANKSNIMITYVCPIMDSKKNTIGAFVIDMNEVPILNILKLETGFKQQCWFLVDNEKNDIIYSQDDKADEIFEKFNKVSSTGEINQISNISIFKDILYVPYVYQVEVFPNVSCYYAVHISSIMRELTATLIIVSFLAVLCIFMIVAIVRIFTAKVISEINGIKTSLEHVKQGNYTDKIIPHSNDELGELAYEFNKVIESLKYQAEHDNMTGFYNSMNFAEKAHEFVKSDNTKKYAIIRIDIDNFSFVNHIYDWDVGNELLKNVAVIVREVFDTDTVYGYLGNDVFVACMAYREKETIYARINRTSDKIKNSNFRIPVTPHFGVFEDAKEASNINVLCDYAGIALKTIKGNMLETYAVYTNKFHEANELHKFVESNKKAALERNDFYIMLQPKCDINTGQVVGAEALVRWRTRENKEELSPSRFIPIFEKSGFIITLDRYVWEETCKVLKKWQDKGLRRIPISVNVSRMHIFQSEFVNDFENLVQKYDIPHNLLEVEVTESALLENIDGLLGKVMTDLKSRGFRLLMDDFASGYSSLIALQNLPFDVIKVDKALIDHIDEPENKQFVSGVVSFLQDLKKDIVIEGVENEQQREILLDTGCNVIQGFCFSKPVSVEAFEVLAFGEDALE